jgi:hypothetical protein
MVVHFSLCFSICLPVCLSVCLTVCLYICLFGNGCLKSEPIVIKFGMELQIVKIARGSTPGGQNLYRCHIYGSIQTKFIINLRNTNGDVVLGK